MKNCTTETGKEADIIIRRFESSPLHDLLLWHARRNYPHNDEEEEEDPRQLQCCWVRWWRTWRASKKKTPITIKREHDDLSAETAFQLFTEAYPEQASSIGLVPLAGVSDSIETKEIGRVLVKVFPQDLGTRNNHGRIPLHHAALRGSSEHISLLIEEGKKQGVGGVKGGGGLFVQDNGMHTPLNLCIENFCRAFCCCGDLESHEWRYYHDDANWPRCFWRVHKDDEAIEWRKVEIMATAAYSAIRDVQGTVLHALIFLDAAPELIQYALKTKPELLRTKDGDGRLPLHVAAMKASAPTEIIKILLDSHAYHGATTALATPDRFGRIPLHAAAVRGWEFDGGMRALFDADPATVEIRDGESKLFPFMLSAVAHGVSIDTVYKLLTAAPSVLKDFLRT